VCRMRDGQCSSTNCIDRRGSFAGLWWVDGRHFITISTPACTAIVSPSCQGLHVPLSCTLQVAALVCLQRRQVPEHGPLQEGRWHNSFQLASIGIEDVRAVANELKQKRENVRVCGVFWAVRDGASMGEVNVRSSIQHSRAFTCTLPCRWRSRLRVLQGLSMLWLRPELRPPKWGQRKRSSIDSRSVAWLGPPSSSASTSPARTPQR
jgi:hypothetical protein